MNKNDLMTQFANRLRMALIKADYASTRSTSGVNIIKFAAMTGHSAQICRKYLRGEAIPEPNKLIEIAKQLNVSPGWLLFGDCYSEKTEDNKITISKDLLHYIFSRTNALYVDKSVKKDEIPNFLLELTNNVSQIKTDNEQSKKVIDLALISLKHFFASTPEIVP